MFASPITPMKEEAMWAMVARMVTPKVSPRTVLRFGTFLVEYIYYSLIFSFSSGFL